MADVNAQPRVATDKHGINWLIPYKNPMALTAHYTSVMSLIPLLGLFLGPTAVVFGVLGLLHLRKEPAAGGAIHAVLAIVLGVVTLVANVAGLVYLAWILIE